MNLEEAINLCTSIIGSLDDIEQALEYTFPVETRSIHAAITNVEEAQYGLSEQFGQSLHGDDDEQRVQL